jgi:hypothetical protein
MTVQQLDRRWPAATHKPKQKKMVEIRVAAVLVVAKAVVGRFPYLVANKTLTLVSLIDDNNNHNNKRQDWKGSTIRVNRKEHPQLQRTTALVLFIVFVQINKQEAKHYQTGSPPESHLFISSTPRLVFVITTSCPKQHHSSILSFWQGLGCRGRMCWIIFCIH